jgi:hypothetical protein
MTWLEDLKLAIKAVFHKNPAGLKEAAIADRMNLPRTFLYRYGDLRQDDVIPLERLVQLVLISGDMRPMAALCRACGGEFVAVKPLAHGSEETALKAVQEFSELMAEYSSAILDGRITPRELATLEREGAEAQQAIAALVGTIRVRVSVTPPHEGGI